MFENAYRNRKTIVYMKNFKIEEISEIHGYDEDKKKLIIERVF